MTISSISLVSDEEFLAYYEAKMRGEDPPITDGKPQGGLYRMRRSKGGPWSRIEIDREDSNIVIKIDGQPAPESDFGRIWSFCARHAVRVETFDFHEEKGYWPGEDAPPADASEIGGNAPPVDLVSQLQEKITAATKWVESIGGKVSEETQLEAIANRTGSIAAARLAADKEREREKAPHLKKCQDIDEKYNPAIKLAKKVEKDLDALGSVFTTARARELAAAEARRAEEAARAAALETARRADEARHDPAAVVGNVVPIVPATMIPTTPPAPKVYGGATGRKKKEKEVSVAVIEDQDAVYQFFKEEPELVALLQKFAQRATDSDVTVPGVKVEKEVKFG